MLKKNHLDEQYVARRSVQDLPKTIAGLSERIANLKADQATAEEHADDAAVIAGRKCFRDDVLPALAGQLDALPLLVTQPTRVELGTYKGLKFGLVLHSQVPPDVYVEGAATRQASLSRAPGAAGGPQYRRTTYLRLRAGSQSHRRRPCHRRIAATRLPGPLGSAVCP